MFTRPIALFLALLVAACSRDPQASLQAARLEQQPQELLQDLREDDARLFGAVQPVPPASDAPRTVIVRWLERGETSSAWTFDGIPVLDARFIPGSKSALVITSARELVLLPSRRDLPVHLDGQVHAPVSISQDGRFAAYARGEAPDLEIVRFDLARRAVLSSTQSMAPAWCPVLSEDGSRLLFMSGSTGYPELWELRADGSTAQRSDRRRDPIPFPSGPSTPVWRQGVMAFENRDGVHLLSVDPPRVLRSVPGALPVSVQGARAVLVQGGHEPLWLSLDGTEVKP